MSKLIKYELLESGDKFKSNSSNALHIVLTDLTAFLNISCHMENAACVKAPYLIGTVALF